MPPELSVVVVAYNMDRELPRTILSLSPDHQRSLPSGTYEIVVVDNGSQRRVDALLPKSEWLRFVRVDDAAASPAAAANLGVRMAHGRIVGLIVDGARMASPGLLRFAALASRLHPRAVITAPAWHLGEVRHMDAHEIGHTGEHEDRLLAEIDWENDGYRLFEVSTLAASSARGWFGPMGESSSLFMSKLLWAELGGLDENFRLPGGGLVNHDLYRRACALPDSELVVLLGEGTFHQSHGGAATSGRVAREDMRREYERIRGESYRPPTREPIYLGSVPAAVLRQLRTSVHLACERLDEGRPYFP